MKAFPIRVFPFFTPLLHPHRPIYAPSVPHPPPFTSFPHFLSHSSPLFHLPPQLTHERAHPRALRAYAYTHTHLHVRRFSFIAFTASPISHNPLCTNALGVKENEKKPSQNTQSPQNQYIKTKTTNFIRRKLHLITAVNPTIPTVNIKIKSLHPLCTVPQLFAAYR